MRSNGSVTVMESPREGAKPFSLAASVKQLKRWLRMDKEQVTKEIRSIAPFLIPFLKMAAIYFVLGLPTDPPTVGAFVKCVPLMSLIWFVWLQGCDSYNSKILAGLVLSCLGDALLVFDVYSEYIFMAGMASFAGAHVIYTIAFGLSPFGLKEFLFSVCVTMAVLSIIVPCVDGVFFYAVVVYSILIALMSWRALARFNLRGDIPWRKIYAAVGAILFVVSDFVLSFNKFCQPIPMARQVVMVTYYGAQLCISLSAVNSRRLGRLHQPEEKAGGPVHANH